MSAKVLSRKQKPSNGKAAKPQRWIQEPDKMATDLRRLLDGAGFHIRCYGSGVHFFLDTDYHDEAADIMELRCDGGIVAIQAVKELERVAEYYTNAAARIRARTHHDGVVAKVADEVWHP